MLAKQFVDLDKTLHDRDTFDCGEPELNTFIRQFAAKHMQAGISRTMVLPSHQKLANGKYPICAFYTVTPSAIRRQTLPPHLSKKLPHYPVPVFLLAQLAVSHDYQGQGLGKITLIQSLEYLWRVNQHLTAYAVVVDCLNQSAQNFYQQFGFELLDEDNSKTRLFLPMKTIEQLFNA